MNTEDEEFARIEREIAERIERKARMQFVNCGDCGEKLGDVHTCTPQPAQQEPVAWMHKIDCERDDRDDFMAYYKRTPGYCIPLYTSPPAQRKPLTDEQILADETLRYYFGQNGGAGPVSKQGRKVVDAIEAAHGIKENT